MCNWQNSASLTVSGSSPVTLRKKSVFNKVISKGLTLNLVFLCTATSFITFMCKSWFHDLMFRFGLNARNHINSSLNVFVDF